MTALKFMVVIAIAGLTLSEYGVTTWSAHLPSQPKIHIISRAEYETPTPAAWPEAAASPDDPASPSVGHVASEPQPSLFTDGAGEVLYEVPDQLPDQVTEKLQGKQIHQTLKEQPADGQQPPKYYMVYCDLCSGISIALLLTALMIVCDVASLTGVNTV